MATGTQRFIVENDGTNPGNIQIAFNGAMAFCAEHSVATITLLVPTKKGLGESVLGGFLGAANAKSLAGGKSMAISDDVALQLESLNTASRGPGIGVVIGVHLRETDFSTLDALAGGDEGNGDAALILLPWLRPEGQHWAETWQPRVLGPDTWAAHSG